MKERNSRHSFGGEYVSLKKVDPKIAAQMQLPDKGRYWWEVGPIESVIRDIINTVQKVSGKSS